jgi:hypothetical protein
VLDPKPPQDQLDALAEKVSYGGNPEHKGSPGDFGLTPPFAPRPDKTRCEPTGIKLKDDALAALRQGVRKGLISRQQRGAYPQNVWSVTKDGLPLEAQLENPEAGSYHGYPLQADDGFGELVLRLWRANESL